MFATIGFKQDKQFWALFLLGYNFLKPFD